MKKDKISRLIAGGMAVLLSLGNLTGTAVAADRSGVAINAANFPDANFRAVISGSTYDRDRNGFLDVNEINAITNIYCEGMGIRSLRGVEYFWNLQGLWCKDNQIAALDVSHNKDLRGLWCSGNNLTTLDLSGNPKLVWVYCYDCSLTSLNVSSNPELAFIECNTNPLPVLDVTHNPKLEHLTCGSCELTSLNLSMNPELAHLDAFRNHLTSLDITHNPKMKRLDIWDNPGLGSINTSNCPGLQYYNCAHNDAYSVDVSHNPELTKLICSYNHLTSLDLSHNPKLAYLDCAVNRIGALDLTYNSELFFLQAFTNDFTALNIGNNRFLIKTYRDGIIKDESMVCRGHSWTIDYGGELMYFLCFDDVVSLQAVAVPEHITPVNHASSVPAGTNTEGLITRETVMQALYNVAGRPSVAGLTTRFTDVNRTAPYADAVIWGEYNHICVGYPDVSSDTFGVGEWITRQDMAFMLQRYAEVMGYNSAFDYGRTDDFIDYFDIDYYAWEGVTWAVTWNYMVGKGAPGAPKSELRIDPHGRATREEFIAMALGMMQ